MKVCGINCGNRVRSCNPCTLHMPMPNEAPARVESMSDANMAAINCIPIGRDRSKHSQTSQAS